MKYARQLEQSIAWIREHPRATNLEVPENLRSSWVFEEAESGIRPQGFHFSVFTFGHLNLETLTDGHPPAHRRTVSLIQLIEKFELWQLKLALAEVHYRTHVELSPVPLFHFAENETVECRTRS